MYAPGLLQPPPGVRLRPGPGHGEDVGVAGAPGGPALLAVDGHGGTAQEETNRQGKVEN